MRRLLPALAVLSGCAWISDTELDDRKDFDGDGYIGASFAGGTDCDDTDPAVHPGAEEVWYDGVDADCDGNDDDQDGDGFALAEDCDDAERLANPGAVEVCDGIDNDCDGLTDAEDTDAGLGANWYADEDVDGYGDPGTERFTCSPPAGWVDRAGDCDDQDAAVNPLATEVCDGIDNDCDQGIDADDPDDAVGRAWYLDSDGDGYGDADTSVFGCAPSTAYVDVSGDCNDQDPDINPGAPEICNRFVDDNCNGTADSLDPTLDPLLAPTGYRDSDGDGYGVGLPTTYCEGRYAPLDGDCNDNEEQTHPGMWELCDNRDNDCDANTPINSCTYSVGRDVVVSSALTSGLWIEPGRRVWAGSLLPAAPGVLYGFDDFYGVFDPATADVQWSGPTVDDFAGQRTAVNDLGHLLTIDDLGNATLELDASAGGIFGQVAFTTSATRLTAVGFAEQPLEPLPSVVIASETQVSVVPIDGIANNPDLDTAATRYAVPGVEEVLNVDGYLQLRTADTLYTFPLTPGVYGLGDATGVVTGLSSGAPMDLGGEDRNGGVQLMVLDNDVVYSHSYDPTLTQAFAGRTEFSSELLLRCDHDGDGQDERWTYSSSTGHLSYYGSATIELAVFELPTLRDAVCGDVDGDGLEDVVVSSGTPVALWLIRGNDL